MHRLTNLESPLRLVETSELSIVECGAEKSSVWDSFVKEASGTYCHLFGWKQVFEQTYGLQTHYLVIRSSEVWLGVLPLAVMPRLPGGARKAVSLPYCNYGGLLVADGIDDAPIKAAAIDYLASLGIDKIEFRDIAPGTADAGEVTMVVALPKSPGLLWKQIGDKARNQIRKAQKAGLTLRWGGDQGDELYAIYARNMGRLGTPVHSPKFIKAILSSLGEQADVLTVRHEEQAIGAMLVIKQGDAWSDPMASCLAEFNRLNPNMLLYWEALRAACDAGAKTFDFGRSQKDSGTYRFKRQWGANEVTLHYHSYKHRELVPSVLAHFYRGQSASKLADIWRQLPTCVQGQLGPVIRRWLP